MFSPPPRTTSATLSKFEKAKVLGLRMEQLSRGAAPLVELPDKANLTDREIAMLELRAQKIPFVIVRSLPDGTKEKRKLSELRVE
jgi:DNA-directed RNA polymerases I, II, and III subunit RPABC2